MSRAQTKVEGDPTPITGGRTPARLVRNLTHPDVPVSAEPLDRHILRLLSLHEDVAAKFKGINLTHMDAAAKRAFLAEINDLLGVMAVPFPPGP